MNAGLILLLFCLTVAGLMMGHVKYQEMMLVTRGNDKVVSISNVGSFFDKMENILERSFRYEYGEKNRQAQYRFVFSRLADLWPVIGLVLVLVYGYHRLTREQAVGVLTALRSGPVSLKDYYWAKVISGVAYWGIVCGGYMFVLLFYALVKQGLSTGLLCAVVAGSVLFWGYCAGLWCLYLLIGLGLSDPTRAGVILLIIVLVFGVLLPAGVQTGARMMAGPAPKVPYLTHTPGILAFVSERDRTKEEIRAIVQDQQVLAQYHQAVVIYLKRGIVAEARLTYLSPILLFHRLEKVLFRPEMADFSQYLDGVRGRPSIAHFLQQEVGMVVFLGIFLLLLTVLPPILIRNREQGRKSIQNNSQKNAKLA